MSSTTIIDVARYAGVSKSTVSLVLNDSERVRPRTAQKVWEAINALNYVPNRAARALQSGNSNLIGIIVSDVINPYYAELIRSVTTHAIENAYDVFSVDLNYDAAAMPAKLASLLEHKPDGVLLFTHHHNDTILETLRQSGLPTVLLNWGATAKNISNLAIDYRSGMCNVVEHLTELGHRRIAFVAGLQKYGDPSGKAEAFHFACRKFSAVLDTPLFFEGDLKLNHAAATDVIDSMLTVPIDKRPTAIIAANDLMAISILNELQENDFQVPADISLVGIDDIELAGFIRPKLTTLRQPRRQTGEIAFNLFKQLIEQETTTGISHSISLRLVKRDSTGVAPS